MLQLCIKIFLQTTRSPAIIDACSRHNNKLYFSFSDPQFIILSFFYSFFISCTIIYVHSLCTSRYNKKGSMFFIYHSIDKNVFLLPHFLYFSIQRKPKLQCSYWCPFSPAHHLPTYLRFLSPNLN